MPYTIEHKLKSKERILLSATELFCRFGFDKVSISQVMRLAKMTHGAFYAHFASKEALYKASFLQTLNDSSAGRLAKMPFSLQHLTRLAGNMLNLRALSDHSGPSPENILFNEIASDRTEIRCLYEKSYFGILKILEKRIIALNKLKQLSIATNRAAIREKARIILATLVGAIAISKSIQNEAERQRILLAAQNQILGLLGVNELISD